jgi:ATP-dependent Lon protease
MSDFRDAKVMAQSLREAMSTKQITLTNSESLEIASRMLGFADWNTLSASINTHRGKPAQANPPPGSGCLSVPVLPVKDFIAFPNEQIPFFIKRQKTVQALRQAFSNRRELVVVAQKSQSVEEPNADDVYDVGVLARVLDVGPPSEETIAHAPWLEGSTQVLVQTHGRVSIRNFSGQAGRYEAEADPIDEAATPASSDLIGRAAAQFDKYIAAREIRIPQTWPPLRQLHDPGRVADIIAQRLPIAMEPKQTVLATLDPVARLEVVLAQMQS